MPISGDMAPPAGGDPDIPDTPSNTRDLRVRKLLVAARALAVLAGGISLSCLMAFALGLVAPGRAEARHLMKPASALCGVLLSLSLWLSIGAPTRRRSTLARGLAIFTG